MSMLNEASIANGIKAVLVAGVAIVGFRVYSGAAVGAEADFLNNLAADARDYISADADASGLSAANMIAVKKVSPSRISGTNVTGRWGGTLTIATANIGGSANDGFTLSESAPTDKCESLAKKMAESAATISIAGTSVKAYGGNFNTSATTTQCSSTATPTVTFGFTAK